MEVREDQSLKPPVHDVCARGVIVEYEAAARPVPVKPKASWPLRVLMGWFGLGTLNWCDQLGDACRHRSGDVS